MVTLVIDRDNAGPVSDSKADPPPAQTRPMPPLALVRSAVEMVCVGLIFALFLLRGLDAVIHG
jgi:hypothetical protein